MDRITLGVGGGLVVLGVAVFASTGADSPTALLPALLGLVLVVLGAVATRPALRKHALHAAMAFALLGLLGTSMNLAELPALLEGTAERPSAVAASAVTAVVLAVYLALGIRSFVAARRQPA